LQRASEAANRAVTLAPNAPEGYIARSLIRGHFLWDWTGARSDIERALALDPNNAHSLADYADLLGRLGLMPQALATARRAVDVDPLSGQAWETLASILSTDGQFTAAREALQRTDQLNPGAIHSGSRLAEVELLDGHPDRAMTIAARARHLDQEISRHLGLPNR
jgi:tetratricopeptide (TPR) repeat protein